MHRAGQPRVWHAHLHGHGCLPARRDAGGGLRRRRDLAVLLDRRTHATESESYRRISFSGNIWTVTDRDGTVSRFSSVATIAGISPAAGTPSYQLAYSYRWLLTSVTDANGNAVTYTYSCRGSAANPINPTCYPNTISYNGTIITLYREARPDKLLMGNGLDISETAYRIKSIVTKVGGVLRMPISCNTTRRRFSTPRG